MNHSLSEVPVIKKTGGCMSVIETASRVLRDEAAAVESLVNKLDGQFEKAVRMIDESKGAWFLTGRGKSATSPAR